MRPKPLIPTSVSDMIAFYEYEPKDVWRGFEEAMRRL
jgi:hypothetical protein